MTLRLTGMWKLRCTNAALTASSAVSVIEHEVHASAAG